MSVNATTPLRRVPVRVAGRTAGENVGNLPTAWLKLAERGPNRKAAALAGKPGPAAPCRGNMEGKPGSIWKQALAVLGVCAVLYFGGFWAMQHWRARRGPWVVTFQTSGEGFPQLTIAAPGLGVSNVLVVFPGTNLPPRGDVVTVTFDDPTRVAAVPFGRVKFLDTTFLPGTVTFELFGHEIELLPRTLIVNKREHPWRNGERIELSAR
jgi:hypothetical protein